MRSLWGVCESFWLVVLWWIFEFFKIFWQTFLYENFLIRIIWQTFYILRNNIFVEPIFKWWSYSCVNWIMTLRPRISMTVHWLCYWHCILYHWRTIFCPQILFLPTNPVKSILPTWVSQVGPSSHQPFLGSNMMKIVLYFIFIQIELEGLNKSW